MLKLQPFHCHERCGSEAGMVTVGLIENNGSLLLQGLTKAPSILAPMSKQHCGTLQVHHIIYDSYKCTGTHKAHKCTNSGPKHNETF